MSLPILENSSAAQEALQNPPSPSSPPDASPTFQYPLIQLYPDFPDPNAMDVDQSPPESPNQEPIGLLGLQALGDKHIKSVNFSSLPHNSLPSAGAHVLNSLNFAPSCTQLPRLQIANYPGLEGRRAMFTQCMQCGGISQITNL